MPPSEQPRIFLSYARKDGAALAQRLHQDLTDEGFDVWIDEQRLTAGDVWRDEIADAIDRAGVFLALLSAGSYTSDVCRVEQQQALEKGKPIIPVLVQSPCEIPDNLKTLQRLDFSDSNLYQALRPKLTASIQKQAGVEVTAVVMARHNNAPALPETFVNRPEILRALRNTLFTEGANRSIALTAMQGMGGIGKTLLARALCHDEVVQQAFPDGIFWFDIGKESQLSFSERIKGVPGLHKLLGEFDGETACRSLYNDVLRDKAALIVLDDVWCASDVQPFVAESPRSRLLITTRDTSIKSWVGAREFIANLLTEAESRQVLANWCGRTVAELPPQANEVIHECGYLPLALAMIGAQLRGKREIFWNSVLENLRNADLQKIKAQFPEPHTTLFRAIQISVDALDESARQHYLALAVLLEDIAAAPQVQECIWVVDETEAAETAQKFVDLSLATYDQPEGSIRLHDLQLDYVRAIAREYLPALHSQLVQSYQLRYPGGWHKGPNDGHFFEYLAYHLAEAKRFAEAKDVLTNQGFIYTKFSNRISFLTNLRVAVQVKCTDDMATAMVAVCENEGPEGFWGQFRAALSQKFGHYTEWPGTVRNRLATSRNFGAQLFVATTLGMEGMRTEAIKVFKRILRLGFSQRDYWKTSIRLSVIYQETGRTGQALQILNKLVEQPGAIKQFEDDYWWAQYQIGKNLLSQGQLNRAKEILENVRRRARDGSRKTAALHQLGVIDLESGTFEEAERKFKKCLDERLNVTTNHRRAFEYRRLGDVYALTGRATEAEAAFSTALDVSRSCGDWRYIEEIRQDRSKFLLVAFLRTHKPPSVNLLGLCSKFEIKKRGLCEAFAILGAAHEGYLEVIDEDSARPTGRAARWEVIHSTGLWHASVAVLVADSRGRVALQRRGEPDSYGKWDISAAGHLDVGESDLHAAVREVHEELQLEIGDAELARMGRPYQYRKVGGPAVRCDKHESATAYVYWRSIKNQERISLFVAKVSEKLKRQIRASGVGAALSIEWRTPQEVKMLATDNPGQCASSLKQFFTSNETLSRIETVIQDTQEG